MQRMADLFMILSLLALGPSVVLSAELCSSAAIDYCLKPLSSYRLEDSTNVIVNISDATLTTICRAYKEEVETCFNQYCGDAYKHKYEGSIAVFQYLCVDSLQEYERHRECLASPKVHEDGRSCNWAASFNFTMDTFQPGWSNYEARDICQRIKAYLECVERAVWSVCGQGAAIWQKGFSQMSRATQISYTGCLLNNWRMSGRGANSPCSRASIDECTKPLEQYQLGVGTGLIPNYPADTMMEICKLYTGVQSCIEEFEDSCIHMDKAFLQGIHAKYKYICDTDFAGFVKQRACLTDPEVLQKGPHCNSSFVLNPRTDVNRCGHYNAYVGCRNLEIERLCGSQAAAWLKGLDKAALQPLLSLTKCTLDPSKKDNCLNFEDLTRCQAPLEYFGPTNNGILAYPIDKLKAWCRAYEDIWPCIDTLLGNCDPDHKLVYDARRGAYQYLCHAHFDDFLRHRECLTNQTVQRNALNCHHNHYYQDNKGSINVCNDINTYLLCTYDAISPLCGQEAAGLLRGEAEAYVHPLATKYNCFHPPIDTRATHQQDKPGTNKASIIAPVVLISLILLVLAAVGGFCYWKRRTGKEVNNEAENGEVNEGYVPPAQTVVYNPASPDPVQLDTDAGADGAMAAIPPDLVPPPYTEKDPAFDDLATGYSDPIDKEKVPLPPDYETLPDVASPVYDDVASEKEPTGNDDRYDE